jgi:aminoglycoside phosphotransferase (APT) family kinase protein
VLVHSDYKPANVKWLPDERDVLVLDWEFAWAGPPLLDAGMILRWGAPPAFVSGLACGYRASGGELPDGWRRTADLLDLFNLVGLLAMETSDPVREGDLLRRIEETLQG